MGPPGGGGGADLDDLLPPALGGAEGLALRRVPRAHLLVGDAPPPGDWRMGSGGGRVPV